VCQTDRELQTKVCNHLTASLTEAFSVKVGSFLNPVSVLAGPDHDGEGCARAQRIGAPF